MSSCFDFDERLEESDEIFLFLSELGFHSETFVEQGQNGRHISPNDGELSLLNAGKKKRSRKPIEQLIVPKRAKLYAFPSYDRSDSLLFLPTTLTRHLNTGDLLAVRGLLSKYLDKHCLISLDERFQNMNLHTLMQVYQLMEDFQPDRIMCVSNTRVVSNTIRATIHLKFTDSKIIHDSVRHEHNPTVQSLRPTNHTIHSDNREQRYRDAINSVPRAPEDAQRMIDMVDSQQNIVVYVNMELVLTVNDHTKKITNFSSFGSISSVQLQ